MELPSKDCYLEFPSIPGVYGWVEVDGKPLELHGIKTTRQSACAHIEAEGNKPFSVCYADLRREAPEDSFEVDQSVDGTSMNILQFNKNDELWTTKPNYRDRYTRWSGWHMPGGKTQKSYFFPATDGTAHTGSISLTYERVKLNEEKPQEQEVPHPDELESAPREFFLQQYDPRSVVSALPRPVGRAPASEEQPVSVFFDYGSTDYLHRHGLLNEQNRPVLGECPFARKYSAGLSGPFSALGRPHAGYSPTPAYSPTLPSFGDGSANASARYSGKPSPLFEADSPRFSPTSPVYSPMFDVGYSSTAAAPRRADNRSPSLGIGPSHLHDNRESDAAIPTPQNLSSRLPREQGCAPTRKCK